MIPLIRRVHKGVHGAVRKACQGVVGGALVRIQERLLACKAVPQAHPDKVTCSSRNRPNAGQLTPPPPTSTISFRNTQTSVADSSSSSPLATAKSGWQVRIELRYACLISRSVAVGGCAAPATLISYFTTGTGKILHASSAVLRWGQLTTPSSW